MQFQPIHKTLVGLEITLVLFAMMLLYFLSQSLFFIFSSEDYLELIDKLTSNFSGSFLVEDIKKNYVNESHFEFIKKNFWIFSVFFILLTSFAIYLLVNTLGSLPHLFISKDNHLNKKWIWFLPILLISWLLYKLLLFDYLPLHIDEMFDFVFYSKNSWFCRHTYLFADGQQWYNNHLLYTDFSAFFYQLGFGNKLSIRLPSILAEFILLCYLWYKLRDESPYKFLVLAAVLISSFWLSIYSVEGRAYYLIGTVSCISYFIAKDLLLQPNKEQFLEFVILSIIGFGLSKLYSIPFLGIVIFIGLQVRTKKQISFWVLTLTFIGIITFLFYAPALILSGFRAIYSPLYSPRYLGLRLYPLIFEAISVVTNIDKKAYLGLLFLIGFLFVFRKKLTLPTKRIILFVIAQFISVAFFSLLMGTYFPERSFIYLNIYLTILICFALWDILENKKWILTIFCLIWISNTWYNFNYSWLANNERFVLGRGYYKKMEQAGEKLKTLQLDQIYIPKNEYLLLVFAKYYTDSEIISNAKKSLASELPELRFYNEPNKNENYIELTTGFEITLKEKVKNLK